MLAAAGFPADLDAARGLNHGAWVPLLIAWPHADLPVLQLSLQTRLGAAHHERIGQALAGLREQGLLIVGSGSFTHDLRRFRGQPVDAPAPPDVTAFADWMNAAILEGRRSDLLDYRRQAPFAAQNHPTEEHLLPLFIAMGAAGERAQARHLHQSGMYGILRMDAYAFG
jgi:4,5-DOPA dioxygenase extradiol